MISHITKDNVSGDCFVKLKSSQAGFEGMKALEIAGETAWKQARESPEICLLLQCNPYSQQGRSQKPKALPLFWGVPSFL